MRAFLVDPTSKTVEEVDYDGSPAALTALYPYNSMKCEQVNSFGDHMLYNPDAFHDGTSVRDGVWGVNCGRCEVLHRYAGRSVIFGTYRDDPGFPQDPIVSARGYAEAIQWHLPADDTLSVTIHSDGEVTTMSMTDEELVEYLLGRKH